MKKIIFLSSYPPRECGLATFTRDISEAIQKKFGNSVEPGIVALNEAETSLYKYPKKVAFQITEQDISTYEGAASKINSMKNADIVNIQHEFGLFGGAYGSHIIRLMECLDKKIVTTFHTVLEQPDSSRRGVVRKICSLSDRVVVMTEIAKKILAKDYGIWRKKILVIPHGVPGVKFGIEEKAKRKYGITSKNILLTFGLLSRGKGVENVISALPQIIARHPDTTYVIVGQTHPRVREREGESYRLELKQLAERLGVSQNVRFLDKYLPLNEIVECLSMATIYVSPTLDQKQICSGTVSYAMGAGKAILSSQNKYNSEVLSSGRGILVDKVSPEFFAEHAIILLDNIQLRQSLEKNAFEYSRKMTWPNVSTQYYAAFNEISQIGSYEFSRVPRLNFRHFYGMTDDFGMVQFANYATPDKSSGYTLDDNSRALTVSVKAYEKFGSAKMLKYAGTYLSFIEKCQISDGRFHNIVGDNRDFCDDVGSEDSFGRAVKALGNTINSALPADLRLRSKNILEKTLQQGNGIVSPRAQADALMGIMSSSDFFRGETDIIREKLIDSLVSKYVEVSDGNWKWFEEYLTYGNSKIPEALFEANNADKTGSAEKIARESIDFLTKTLFISGKFVPIGQEKWYFKDKTRGMYDQQPIEAAGMTTAYLKAFEKTGEKEYVQKARGTFDWFLGKNSANQVVYDEATGGCFDGITRNGVNANEGAESTISYLLARLSII